MIDVISAIRGFAFKENEKHVSVALSGGADSMALLVGLNMLKSELGITVSALHLNHCLRGDESLRDEAFVKEQCEKRNIPLICKRVDVAAVAEQKGISIELAARKVRYDFFEKNNAGVVATAHTADDNIETVLYRLTRATGIDGLCGIPARRDVYIRPLLCCERKDIEDFLKEYNVPFVTDSTNLTDEYTRNRIRHKIVPVLKEFNPSLCSSFADTLSLIKSDSDYLSTVADNEFKKRYSGGKLSVRDFENLHKAIASRVIGRFLSENSEGDNNYSINGVMEIALKKSGRFQIKGGKMVKSAKGYLSFEETNENISFKTDIKKESVDLIKNGEKFNNLLLKNAIDCDKIVGSLTIRTKMAGDSITFSHRKVSKPLNKWMNEEAVDTHIRDILPVISDEKGVVWVYGGGVDARVCPDKNTKYVYRIFSEKLGGK